MSLDRFRLLWILPLAAALVWLLSEFATRGPILMILLGLPLVLGSVPKNWLYGLRTSRTLRSSDEVWYIQNLITGAAMVAGGSSGLSSWEYADTAKSQATAHRGLSRKLSPPSAPIESRCCAA